MVELIAPYLDDAMPADERILVERHLEQCDGCLTYIEQMRLTIRASGHVSEEAITARTREPVLVIFRAWREGQKRVVGL